jgi:hypothetical protein
MALLVVLRKPICCFVALRNFLSIVSRSLWGMFDTPKGKEIPVKKYALCFMYASLLVVSRCLAAAQNPMNLVISALYLPLLLPSGVEWQPRVLQDSVVSFRGIFTLVVSRQCVIVVSIGVCAMLFMDAMPLGVQCHVSM